MGRIRMLYKEKPCFGKHMCLGITLVATLVYVDRVVITLVATLVYVDRVGITLVPTLVYVRR
jgi:hypothetical protein